MAETVGISAEMSLENRISAQMAKILTSMQGTLGAFQKLNDACQSGLDVSGFSNVQSVLDQLTSDADAARRELGNIDFDWAPDTGIEVFDTSGIERYKQELGSANEMYIKLAESQNKILQNAKSANILPPNAIADIENVNLRIQKIGEKIAAISANPLSISENESAKLERLREQLNSLLQVQEEFNNASNGNQFEQANQAFLRMSQQIQATERSLRDQFSQEINIPVTAEWYSNSWEQQTATVAESLSKIMELQENITSKAAASTVLDPQAQYDIGNLENRLAEMALLIDRFKNSPLSVNTEEAARAMADINAKVEHIYLLSGSLDIAIDTGNITKANADFLELNENISNVMNTAQNLMQATEFNWQTPQLIEVFDTSGFERAQQEIGGVTSLLRNLESTSNQIAQAASNAIFLPPNAVADIENYNNKITTLKQKIEEIVSRPMDSWTPKDFADLENLREQLNLLNSGALQFVNALNEGNVSAVNQSFARTAQQIQNTERQVRDKFQQPMEIPVKWQSPELIEVFNTTGFERTQQEIGSVNSMLEGLNTTEEQLMSTVANADFLPPNAIADIEDYGNKIAALSQEIAEITSKPMELLTDEDSARLERLREQMNAVKIGALQVIDTLNEGDISALNQSLLRAAQQVQSTSQQVRDQFSQPIPISVEWQTDTELEVFDTSGIERWQQEINRTTSLMSQLANAQDTIAQSAVYGNILPPNAAADMIRLNERIGRIQQRVHELNSRPANAITDAEIREAEQLSEQLNRALQLENQMNTAAENLDISAANTAYQQLSQTIGNAERLLRDSTSEQVNFNNEIQKGQSEMDKLTGFIKKAVGAFVSLQTVKGALNLSDEMSGISGRLNMIDIGSAINIPLNVETDAAVNANDILEMTYQAAQRAGGSLQGMADVIARFGNNAGDAFDSTEQVVQFSELVQKQMTIAGASADEASNAMLQLSQALGSGVLRGDELNSIFEQAPNLIQGIADYLDVPIGQIREMASEGQLTADVVRNSVLEQADTINERFKTMPKTWAMVWESAKNTATMAIQPILGEISNAASAVYDQIDEIANTGTIQSLAEQFTPIIPAVSQIVQTVIGMIPQIATALAPIITILSKIINFVVSNIPVIQSVIGSVSNALLKVMNILEPVTGFMMSAAQGIIDNWDKIVPVIGAVVTAIGLYKAAVIATNTIQAISTTLKGIAAIAAVAHGTATIAEAAATTGLTQAQVAFNASLLACPITWIVVGILLAAAAFVMFTEQIVGAVFWVGALGKNVGLWCANVGIAVWNTIKNIGQWFVNLGQSAWAVIYNIGAWFRNVFFGLVEVVKAVGENIGSAFNNAWVFIQTGFWTLVDNISQGLKDVAEFANKCLGWAGVDIDTSGFDFAKQQIAELSEQYKDFRDIGEAWDTGFHTVEYKSVSEPWEDNPIDWAGDWNKGMNTFDVFQEGWGADAYNAGAEIGAGLHDFIMSGFGLFDGFDDVFGTDNDNTYNSNFMKTLGNIADSGNTADDALNEIAGNTSSISDSVISEEDLKYLRDIAERDVVNRFTTAKISVSMGGITQNVNSDTDLDGIVNYIANGVRDAMEKCAEGVHC